MGADHVGARASALGAAEVVTLAVWGTNGNCTIPNTATGIATNVTVDLVIDIVGDYLPAGVGTPGPPGRAAGGSITFTGLNATFDSLGATVDPTNGCATLMAGSPDGQLFVPLPVPDGATIVAVRVRTFDSDSFPSRASPRTSSTGSISASPRQSWRPSTP